MSVDLINCFTNFSSFFADKYGVLWTTSESSLYTSMLAEEFSSKSRKGIKCIKGIGSNSQIKYRALMEKYVNSIMWAEN